MTDPTRPEPTTPHVYTALADVMRGVTHVAKRDFNSHQRFNFRGIDAVVNALGPVMREHRLLLLPQLVSEDTRQVQTSREKLSTEVRVTVDYVFVSPLDGSTHTVRTSGTAWDTGDKAAPKAWSIALRTMLLQVFMLPTDEPDPDSYTYEGTVGQQPVPAGGGTQVMRRGATAAASGEQVRLITAKFTELGYTDPGEVSWHCSRIVGEHIDKPDGLTSDQAAHVLGELDARIAAVSGESDPG